MVQEENKVMVQEENSLIVKEPKTTNMQIIMEELANFKQHLMVIAFNGNVSCTGGINWVDGSLEKTFEYIEELVQELKR